MSSDLYEPLHKQTADLLFVRDPLINQPQEPAHLFLPSGYPELAPPLQDGLITGIHAMPEPGMDSGRPIDPRIAGHR